MYIYDRCSIQIVGSPGVSKGLEFIQLCHEFAPVII